MARQKVYIGVDLQPNLFRFVVVNHRGKILMSGERQIEGDGHSWSHEFATILQNDEDRETEALIEQSERVWGFAPSFASGVTRSIFIPSEARPVKNYVEWETSIYMGDSADHFFLSWEMGPAVAGGNLLHLTSVRKEEFQGFAAGLSNAGVLPVLIEGTLVSAYNSLSREAKKKKLPPLAIALKEGELYRIGYFEKGSLMQQSIVKASENEFADQLLQFFQSGSYAPAMLYHQIDELVDEEKVSEFSSAISIPVLPLPAGAHASSLFAVAHSVALRTKEVDQ